MKDAIAVLPIAGFLLGLLTSLAGVLVFYRNSVQKRYAAERDFQHLKRNYESIVQMLTIISDEIDDVRLEVVRGFSSTKKSD